MKSDNGELSLWTATPRPNPAARFRLFCFPYAGAGAMAYRLWPEGLPGEVEVCAIQLPGRENRFKEPPSTDLETVISALAAALYPYHLDRPFAFFGHSLGALMAFELARRLRELYALQPRHLFLSGRIAPQLRDPRPPIYSLPEGEFLTMLRKLNGTPEEILTNPELAPLRAVLRADFELNERYTYIPAEPFNIPISVYGGVRDPKVTETELRQWAAHTKCEFELRMFLGDHFFVQTERPRLLQVIAGVLFSLL